MSYFKQTTNTRPNQKYKIEVAVWIMNCVSRVCVSINALKERYEFGTENI